MARWSEKVGFKTLNLVIQEKLRRKIKCFSICIYLTIVSKLKKKSKGEINYFIILVEHFNTHILLYDHLFEDRKSSSFRDISIIIKHIKWMYIST